MRNLLRPTLPILLILLSACAALGLANADTFNKQLAYASGNLAAVMASVATNVTSGDISVTDARKAIEEGKNIQTGLDAARSIAKSGNITDANTRLAVASAALTVLQDFINQHKKGHIE